MFEGLGKNAVVGTKQVLKAMQAGALMRVYLAEDVELFLQNKLKEAAKAYGVEIHMVPSMRELGEACKIEVGAACAGVPRP